MKTQAISSVLLTALIGAATDGQNVPVIKPPASSAPASIAMVPAQSIDELQDLLDRKQYPAAVKLARDLLANPALSATGSNRFQITMLKGEAQVGLKSLPAAAATFTSAMKFAANLHDRSSAKWTGELFSLARNTVYIPKSAPAGSNHVASPLDLLEPANRNRALAALFNDELNKLQPQIQLADRSENLSQILPVLEQALWLDQLQTLIAGPNEKALPVAADLMGHCRSVLAAAISGDPARIDQISDHAYRANRSVKCRLSGVVSQNGVSDPEKDELRRYLSTCQTVSTTAETLMTFANDRPQWSDLRKSAIETVAQAKSLLQAEFDGLLFSSDSSMQVFDDTGPDGKHRPFCGPDDRPVDLDGKSRGMPPVRMVSNQTESLDSTPRH